MFACFTFSSAVLWLVLLASSSQFHPLSFIFYFILWESSCSLMCKVLSRFWLSGALRVWTVQKKRHRWEQTGYNAWNNSFFMLPSWLPAKKAKKILKPKGKVLNSAKIPTAERTQVSIPLEGDEWGVLSVHFDSLFCIFIIIILATRFLELSHFCWLHYVHMIDASFHQQLFYEYICDFLPSSQLLFWQMQI